MNSLRLLHPPHPLVNPADGEWDWVSTHRDYLNLWVCFEGTGTLTVETQPYEVSPGFAILLLPEETVSGKKPAHLPLVNMGLHFQWLDPVLDAEWQAMSDRVVQLRNVPLMRETAAYLERLVFHQEAVVEDQALRAARLMLDLFLVDRSTGRADPVEVRLQECVSEIRAHPQREWSIQNLAASVGLSVSQFGRRFRALFGCSPVEYILQIRMDRARLLLRESLLSVGEISEELGYKDVGYFSRQFKQRTGISPLVYRTSGAAASGIMDTRA